VSSIHARLKGKLAALRLSRLARAVKRQRLTYLSDAKLARLEDALRATCPPQVRGAFVEFGVALGGSAILIAQAAAHADKPFFGFDVFEVIPSPSSDRDDEESHARYQTIISGKASGIGGDLYYGYRDRLYDEVVQAFQRNNLTVDGRRISLVKGLFQDTWPGAQIDEVAFCHIDCDWHDPVKYCLERVAPRLSPDGIILLDDYHDYGGCANATREFLNSSPQFELLDGPNVVVRRRHAA
jgi:asparagine synthase (glutamine-hydrolysing)